MKPFDFVAFCKKYGIALRDEPTVEEEHAPLKPLITRMYHAVRDRPGAVVGELEELVRTHPEERVFWNYLYVAYRETEQKAKALRALQEALLRHPDYLFAAVNYVQFHLQEDWMLKHAPKLGPHLDIRDWPAATDGTYHLSEFFNFEQAVVAVLLFRNEQEAADERIERLRELGFTDHDLQQLSALQFRYRMKPLQRIVDRRTAADAAVRPVAVSPSIMEQDLRHEIIRDLSISDFDEISPEKLDAITALPRSELIADLRLVLRQSLASYLLEGEDGSALYDRELERDAAWISAVHALFVLGGIRATEARREVLDFSRGNTNTIEYFFGDFPNYYYTPVVRILFRDAPEALGDYLMEPYRPIYARIEVAEILSEIGQSSPARRERVIAIFKKHWEYALSESADEHVVSIDLLSNMVYSAAVLRATELLPLAREIDGRGWIDPNWGGTFGEIEPEFDLPLKLPTNEPPLPTALELYRQINDFKRRQSAPPPKPVRQPVARRQPKIGRNEPCPCGSGKKYKRCCLKK